MFSRQLTDRIRLSLSVQAHAEELFALTERNRAFLRQWLPWLDMTTGVDDTRAFLERQLYSFANGDSLTATIFYDGKAAGVAGFNTIDRTNGVGSIGYWLGEEFNGKGIMTRVVEDLIGIGREHYSLQKIEIRCAPENARSRAIPRRLGFQYEGTLRRAERIYDGWHDSEVYSLLL